MAKAVKKHALDIFQTLAAIDGHDMAYFDNLSVDEKKGFHAPVVMRWASAKKGDLADWNLIAINERANMHHFDLYEYTDLQYRLIASVGLGIRSRGEWIASTPKGNRTALSQFIRRYWTDANDVEVSIILKHLREGDNLKVFLNGTGMPSDEIKRIEKLFH